MTENSNESPAVSRFFHTWRALQHRNFRLFIGGQTISLIGTWMTRVATSWLVYKLTQSAWTLGVVGFAGQIPSFILAPFAGVLIDRMDRRKVLIWTQAMAMVQSLILAALTLSHHINITEVIFLSLMQGVINAFDMPARQSFMVKMVGSREDLSNAIAINSSVVNTTRLLGPSLAGMLIAVTSEGWCFLVDGISYIAVLFSLVMIVVPHVAEERPEAASMLGELHEGWKYVTGFRPIRSILSLFCVLSLVGWPFMVLMPVFAAQVLHGGPHTLGFLMAAVGVGSLVSALTMVMRRSVRGLTTTIPIAALLFGVGLIGFGLSNVQWISMALMFVTGYGMMQGLTASNTILQTLVDEEMRGRVMSYYTMAFVGMAPFGSLLSGALANMIGSQNTVVVTGVACILGSLWFWTRLPSIRKDIRPIYEKLGIVPQVNLAVEESSEN